MAALARHGANAGIDLRLEDDKFFEHTAALTVAVKRKRRSPPSFP
jgi:hypothetical protein